MRSCSGSLDRDAEVCREGGPDGFPALGEDEAAEAEDVA